MMKKKMRKKEEAGLERKVAPRILRMFSEDQS